MLERFEGVQGLDVALRVGPVRRQDLVTGRDVPEQRGRRAGDAAHDLPRRPDAKACAYVGHDDRQQPLRPEPQGDLGKAGMLLGELLLGDHRPALQGAEVPEDRRRATEPRPGVMRVQGMAGKRLVGQEQQQGEAVAGRGPACRGHLRPEVHHSAALTRPEQRHRNEIGHGTAGPPHLGRLEPGRGSGRPTGLQQAQKSGGLLPGQVVRQGGCLIGVAAAGCGVLGGGFEEQFAHPEVCVVGWRGAALRGVDRRCPQRVRRGCSQRPDMPTALLGVLGPLGRQGAGLRTGFGKTRPARPELSQPPVLAVDPLAQLPGHGPVPGARRGAAHGGEACGQGVQFGTARIPVPRPLPVRLRAPEPGRRRTRAAQPPHRVGDHPGQRGIEGRKRPRAGGRAHLAQPVLSEYMI
ncbi:hypothetical protein [Streptomyces longisporoflavus]|uniref:Uncharacterized protein n=1 Tax=Streptomyces longisporoflavus TaxID=28044 RepID=A0ABW7QPJ4_9ACTN